MRGLLSLSMPGFSLSDGCRSVSGQSMAPSCSNPHAISMCVSFCYSCQMNGLMVCLHESATDQTRLVQCVCVCVCVCLAGRLGGLLH